jgi:hypothetical protein
VAFKKPLEFFGKKVEGNNLPVVETDNSLREELSKVQSLSEQVVQLQQELSEKVVKNDLESLVLSQINSMQKNFDYLQESFKQSNKKDITKFKEVVSEITSIVSNLVENEIPKYKKQVTKNELRIDEKFDSIKDIVEENILGIKEEVDNKVNDIVESIDESLEHFNSQLQETSSEVKRTADTYNKLSKIVESKVSKENEKLEEYSQVIQSLYETFVELEEKLQKEDSAHLQVIEEKFKTISLDVNDRIDTINEEVKSFENSISSEVLNIKTDVVINEQHIKNVDKYLQENHQELVTLREEVFTEIEQIPLGNLQENLERLEKKIDFIKETYSRIEPEVVVKEVIKEGLLNISPEEKTSDPLSPLNQNFVTLDQLQEHYRLFINRIQQQLSTLGGGGETRLEFLDDVDRNSAKVNGRFLKYDAASGKWVGALGGGGGSQTLDDTLGLGNTSSLGMSVGLSTFNNVIVGGATTALVVNGDARITGILTIGTSSLTLDGKNNLIKIGTGITLSESGGANYSGIITASAFVGDGSLLTNLPGGSGGNSGYANTAGIATYAQTAGIATYAQTAGIATNATTADTATYATTADTANSSNYASAANTATYAGYATNAGSATTSLTSGYATSAGIATTAIYLTDAANILTGTINKDRISTTNALTVLGDLYVSNNISFGGTVTQLNTEQLQVVDPDIVLGIGTSFSPTDDTANHGGIAIASTEGYPLVDLNIVSGETNPSTYKKIMWFKGNTIGAGITDAWLFNYAVGIGSTQVPNGVRLAAGSVQFTERDLVVVRNINSSGIVTALSFSGNSSSATYASTAGIATVAQGLTGTPNLNVGVITATSFFGDGSGLTGIVASGSGVVIQNEGSTVGTATTINFVGDSVTATFSAGIATVTVSGTGGASTNLGVVLASTYNMLMP